MVALQRFLRGVPDVSAHWCHPLHNGKGLPSSHKRSSATRSVSATASTVVRCWGVCDRTCGKARKTRYRTVVAPAAGGGAGCGVSPSTSGARVDCPIDCEVSDFGARHARARVVPERSAVSARSHKLRSTVARRAPSSKTTCGATCKHALPTVLLLNGAAGANARSTALAAFRSASARSSRALRKAAPRAQH